MATTKTFDAVVIGSGLGGLTAAALLARSGRSVCVLERNHSLGGAASVFKVGALTIEASLHQTADPRDPSDPKHQILKGLGVLDEIEWIPIAPFYSVSGGPVGEPFELPHGFDRAQAALVSRFPADGPGIERVLAEIRRVHSGIADLMQARAERSVGKLMRGALGLRSALIHWRASLDDVFSREFGQSEALKCALAANVNYYADDPKQLWWLFFAVAQGGYLGSGGVYIKGGSRNLSMKLARIVTKAGGTVLLGREAVGIDSHGDGSPAFVRHTDRKSRETEERIGAGMVLANCAPTTLAGMLSEPMRGTLGRAYAGRALSTSLFAAHFGLKEPPSKFGLNAYSSVVLPDWIRTFDDIAKSSDLLAADPGARLPVFGIANYGAIDGGLSQGGPTLVSVVGADRLSNWAGLAPEAEQDRRRRWLDAILAALDRRYPGLAGALTEKAFLNARSMHNYLNTPEGAIYGFAPRPPERPIWTGVPRSARTPLPRVYLASAFAGSGGFTGAMLSGANAALLALGEDARR
jgi:phytoene dehydrogenase-like protein